MRNFFYSTIVCILIISILKQLVTNSRQKQLIRPISGIFLAIAIFRSFPQINKGSIRNFSGINQISAESYIAEGKKTAHDANETIIKEACEAYILDKAKMLDADIKIEFHLNENLAPIFAEIHTEADSAVQKQLQNILTTDLGIPKENQTWIWYQESSIS